jgi:hypothetical protein
MGRGPAKKAKVDVQKKPHCIKHGEKLDLYIAAFRMKTRGRCYKGCDLTKANWITR